ncbi:hypothetical protein NFI96_011359, partial [Prochilodus magdalenae]
MELQRAFLAALCALNRGRKFISRASLSLEACRGVVSELRMQSKVQLKEMDKPASCSSSSAAHCFPALLCLLLSGVSVGFCALITFRTAHLEDRVALLESERGSVFGSVPSWLEVNGTLWDLIDKLVQKRLMEEAPKLRTPRDLVQECSCPPGQSEHFHFLKTCFLPGDPTEQPFSALRKFQMFVVQ